MHKPKAVDLRVKLWKLYYPDDKKYIIPKFGLNFLKNETKKNKKFLLICGFENFEKFYVRIDILERFFLKIIENTKNRMIKIDSNMINLIGCNRENFSKLLELMQYIPKKIKETKEEFFIYQPKYINNNNKTVEQKSHKHNHFGKL